MKSVIRRWLVDHHRLNLSQLLRSQRCELSVMCTGSRRGGGDGGGVFALPTLSGKGTRKPNLGGRRAGRLHTRQETRNLGLKAITDKNGPVPIRFEVLTNEDHMLSGDHEAPHWATTSESFVRELPLHFHSWRPKVAERKAWVCKRLGVVFHFPLPSLTLRPQWQSVPHWATNLCGHPAAPAKIYNGKKAALKERYWVPEEDGTYEWRPRRGDEMLRLQGLGANTSMGVPYTEDEIMAIVRGGTFPVLDGFCQDRARSFLPHLKARTPPMSLGSKRGRSDSRNK
ncbi:hypothetical protein Tco_0679768 [Tanacetum coccineum]|uniref:Uncharacterized protein n=1 Tax=Tanacetum coccineum TaxID=301880 RepID=A0ABQ4XJ02_9ASTR